MITVLLPISSFHPFTHQHKPHATNVSTLSFHLTKNKYYLAIADHPFYEHNMKPTTALTTAILALAPIVSAGPAAYGVCQAGCAAVVTACYAAAGFTWGATMGASVPATIIACNTAFGYCQAACWMAAIAPAP